MIGSCISKGSYFSNPLMYFLINRVSLSNFCDCSIGLKILIGFGSAQTEADHCQFQKLIFSS